jgi:DnaJ-class molecular chaperone
MMLHPDKTDGDVKSAEMFKEATEAYDTLSNHGKRTAYDRLFTSGSGLRKPPPNYRKVYARVRRLVFKTFDPKQHFDMHYGDGQMREEIDRAIKRAKEAGGKLEYESPLGPGFTFSSPSDNNTLLSKVTTRSRG